MNRLDLRGRLKRTVARLDSIPAVSNSKVEEIIAGIWTLVAVACFGFHFRWWGLFFALKAAMDTASSIYYAVRGIRSRGES